MTAWRSRGEERSETFACVEGFVVFAEDGEVLVDKWGSGNIFGANRGF